MDIEKAELITSDMMEFHFYDATFFQSDFSTKLIERLKKYTLREMLEASDLLKQHTVEKSEGKRMVGFDEPHIAAIFTFLHFESDSADNCSPIVGWNDEGLYKTK